MFSEREQIYLQSQPLARIATVAMHGQPDVAPVGFRFDGAHFLIGGANPTQTLKYRNVAGGNRLVALSIDDLFSVEPWQPRGIKIHGSATIIAGDVLRIVPQVHWSWGIEGPVWQGGRFAVRRVAWPRVKD